jgi:hypothetical protein
MNAEVGAWRRWQDWAVLAVGAYALLSPLWTSHDRAGMWTLIVLGVLLALSAVWSLAAPGAVGSEYTHMALGVLFFIAPWALSYADVAGAAWTSWIAGVIAFALGLWALPESTATRHRHVLGTH